MPLGKVSTNHLTAHCERPPEGCWDGNDIPIPGHRSLRCTASLVHTHSRPTSMVIGCYFGVEVSVVWCHMVKYLKFRGDRGGGPWVLSGPGNLYDAVLSRFGCHTHDRQPLSLGSGVSVVWCHFGKVAVYCFCTLTVLVLSGGHGSTNFSL